jgi:hypothetical protein
VARILIVGCGCRGQALARGLHAAGHAVRGTTRSPARTTAIEAAGAEPIIADPDRVGTLVPALDGATILCHLLGEATARPLHTTRLETLLHHTIDTTVRAVIYERSPHFPEGASIAETKCAQNKIPLTLLEAEPDDWLPTALRAINALLQGEPG